MKALLRTVLIVLTLTAAILPTDLQAQAIRGPVLGFVADDARTAVRPLLGVPGASAVGDRLPLNVAVRRLQVSPKHDYLLAQRNEDKAVVLFDLAAATFAARPLAFPGIVDLISISPTGSSAAIYDAAARRVHTLSGLPAKPGAVRTFDVAKAAGRVEALSVTDDGALVLVRSKSADGGSEFSVIGDSVSWRAPTDDGAVAFAPGGRDIVVADNLTKSVFLVTDLGGSYARRPLFTAADETDVFNAAAMSADGARVIVTTGSAVVAIMELGTGQMTWLSCQCSPTILEPLKGTSLFRLTEVSATEPIFGLDASSPEPRVVLTLPNTAQ
jgi:hypothetical protein